MTTLAQIRKAASAMAGVSEEGKAPTVTWFVDGTRFVWVADGTLHARLTPPDAAQFLGDHAPDASMHEGDLAFQEITIPLGKINGMASNWVVRTAWASAAPVEQVTALADNRAAASTGDLPTSIGKPATRALAEAGIRSLKDLESWSDERLLGLHGVGPKAVATLRDAIG